MNKSIETLKETLEKLKSIDDFETKDEEFLINSYIDICEDMINREIIPDNEFFDGMNKILELYEETL